MPLMEISGFSPFTPLRNAHLQTIGRFLVRRTHPATTRRERLELPDGDFLDLDWGEVGSADRVVILSHGLEGASSNSDIQGMAAACMQCGWDVVAWNLRGCSGVPNRLPRAYHSGSTDDLDSVVQYVLGSKNYQRVDFIGLSLGGNITLKYLGDRGEEPNPLIGRAVAFSVPCDVASGVLRIDHWSNRIYVRRFLCSLRSKVRQKIQQFPGVVTDRGLNQIRTISEFDEAYTAPLNGFESAMDYWEKSSSRPVLSRISVPTLLVNARNDPFLTPQCFPIPEAARSAFLTLEMPDSGGHLGFMRLIPFSSAWSEKRAIEFLAEIP